MWNATDIVSFHFFWLQMYMGEAPPPPPWSLPSGAAYAFCFWVTVSIFLCF